VTEDLNLFDQHRSAGQAPHLAADVDLPLLGGLYPPSERRIHVLQQYETPVRHQSQQVIQLIVRQPPLGQIEQADIVR